LTFEREFDTLDGMDIDDSMERLATALSDVAAVDLDALCDEQLDALLTGLVRFSHRVQAATSRLAARWDGRSIWTSDGSRSAASRLARDTSSSRQAAAAILRRGRALATMPATTTAICAGSISTEHVDLLAAAAGHGRHDVFARDEATLVDSMRRLRYDQCAKTIAYWRQHADEEIGNDEPPPDASQSTMTISDGAGDETHLVAHLDPVDAAQVTATIGVLAGELRRADHDTGRPQRGLPQLRAAALVEMARRAMSAPSGIARTRPLLTIVCGDQSFARLCELSTGRVITPGALVPHLDHLDIHTILFDGPHRPISASPPDAPPAAPYAKRSPPATATANTTAAATNPSTAATSTMSSRGATTAPPPPTTASCCATTTTASKPQAHDHRRPPSRSSVAPTHRHAPPDVRALSWRGCWRGATAAW
jgi:hypothetical protein